VHPRIGWNQPPTAWDAPGWAPLVDPGPHPLQAARSLGRWLWPTLAIGGFLTVVLAAAVVALLTLHRRYGPGPLARALAEYMVVFVLAVLVATAGVPLDRPAAPTSQASAVGDQRPALVKTIDRFGDWLSEWRAWARTQRHRGTPPEPEGEAVAPPPTPSLSAPSIWRFPA
jgi:hypothetical protein